MAGVEAAQGIHSTFYLRVDGGEYALAEAAAVARLIWDRGHEIGVHVSLGLPRTAGVSDTRLHASACVGFTALREVFGATSKKVSLHAPPASALWREILGFDHAMGPEWEGLYVGDSRGRFMVEPEKMLVHDRVQVNLHPEWWFLPEDRWMALHEQELAKP
jgi:hypothetical protein